MASSYTLKSSSYEGRYLELYCTQTTNIATNTSTIKWTLTSTGGNDDYYTTGPTTVKINGKEVYYKGRTNWNTYAFPAAKGSVSGTIQVKHNNSGKASVSLSLSTAIYYSTVETKSQSWTLDDIPRQATLTAAPHFTDEENPTITYANPAGEAVESLQACIANEGGNWTYANYRDIPKTGTNYTFELTDEERNALRWASINSPNLAVKFYVTTIVGGQVFYSTLDKIMTIANAAPVLDPVVKDTGGYSTPLTGDANKIIKGFNYMNVVSNAATLKGATIKSQTIRCGENVISGGSGGFDNVETNVFEFTVTDSRGYTTTQTITKELIEYIKLTCNLKANNPTAEGTMSLRINGNYFNGSFGAQANTLNVYYRYKENNKAYGEWIAATPEITNNTYDATINLTGLNYKSAYTFQAKAADKTITIETAEKRVKAIPVFDWSENDFQFNVDVFDKNNSKLGTEITANDYDAVMGSGKALLESGWVTITPTAANTPTAAYITFKRHYKKIPVVLVTASSGVIGTQVLGASTNGITNDGANIVITRTNTTPTSIYYYVFGEVE